MTNTEIKERNLKRVFSLLGENDLAACIKKIQTQCSARLGIGPIDYRLCRNTLNVPINGVVISEDRIRFRKESVVQQFCKKLKVSADVLRDKVTRFVPIGANSKQMTIIREVLGIKYDHSAKQLMLRSPQYMREEKKIIKYWNSGKTYKQISLALGIPMGNVMGRVVGMRMRGMNVPIRPPGGFTREVGFNIDDIASLIRTGMSAKDIALKFNKKPHSMAGLISLWRSKFGVEKVPHIIKKQRHEKK